MSWLRQTLPGDTPLDQVLGHRSNLHRSYQDFYQLFWERELLPPRILELCRLRIAQLYKCRAELAAPSSAALGVECSPQFLRRLANWHREPEFDDGERACLEVAELFVQDPHAISDELASAAIARLGEAGFVALAEALAMIDSRVRIQCMLQVSPAEGKTAK